jgi:hypothetical protein
MEAADALYGVTMAPGGSSKVISQKVARRPGETPTEEPATSSPTPPPAPPRMIEAEPAARVEP